MIFLRKILNSGLLLLLAGTLAARTLEELEVSYEVRILELNNAHTESLDKLVRDYLGALDRVQKTLQKSGRLDDVLKVTQEKEDLKNKSWPLPNLVDPSPADLVKVRNLYEKTRILADRENAASLDEVAKKMDKLLENLVRTLTKEGKIPEAKKARARREAVATDPKVVAARNFLKRVRLDQSSPVAVRARRSGDDLEVLVRFDKSGNLSMDSPVENVVEITGGQKQKGETKATVLGEFVGAKGYKVDSYVAFKNDLDDPLPPQMHVVSLEATPGVTQEGRKCLRIKMGPKAPNPRIEWAGLLAPISSASQVKLDFNYFIPKKNEKLIGFAFHQGLLAPLDGKVMATRGRWVQESIVAAPINENSHLRFYFEGLSGGGKTFDGAHEVVYLDDLTVTFQQFAAHTVSNYKDGTLTGEPVTDVKLQKAFILSGRFVSSN